MSNFIEINPVKELDAVVSAPPSKAFTLRALFISALADNESRLANPLIAQDQVHAINALKAFDIPVSVSPEQNFVSVSGCSGKLTAPSGEIFVGNSGVTARFLASFAALAQGKTSVSGDERMYSRPIGKLLSALEQLGVVSSSNQGFPPYSICGPSFSGGHAFLSGDESSQFFSSILLSAPYAEKDVSLECSASLLSKPYIDLTIDSMKSFGVKAENQDYKNFFVQAGQNYSSRNYSIEGDYSSAGYFFAAAAVTGGKLSVKNLNPESVQGDKIFLEILSDMGCKTVFEDNAVKIEAGKKLSAVEVDLSSCPDIVPTAAVVAAFASGTSVFRNISHLKFKESNRLEAPVFELRKMGIQAEFGEDFIKVRGGNPKPALIETYNDHRIAMAFSVAGLAVSGTRISNPSCVKKSFPGFFESFNKLGGEEK